MALEKDFLGHYEISAYAKLIGAEFCTITSNIYSDAIFVSRDGKLIQAPLLNAKEDWLDRHWDHRKKIAGRMDLSLGFMLLNEAVNKELETPSTDEKKLLMKVQMLGQDEFEAGGCIYVMQDNQILLKKCLIKTGEVELLNGISGFMRTDWATSPFSDCVSLKIKSKSRIASVLSMFENCKLLEEIDLTEFTMSNCRDMTRLFKGCSRLKTIKLNGADTSKVKSMQEMFYGCRSLKELDISELDTSSVINIGKMFIYCDKLTKLNIGRMNTDNVRYADGILFGCRKLVNINVNNELMNTLIYTLRLTEKISKYI